MNCISRTIYFLIFFSAFIMYALLRKQIRNIINGGGCGGGGGGCSSGCSDRVEVKNIYFSICNRWMSRCMSTFRLDSSLFYHFLMLRDSTVMHLHPFLVAASTETFKMFYCLGLSFMSLSLRKFNLPSQFYSSRQFYLSDVLMPFAARINERMRQMTQ